MKDQKKYPQAPIPVPPELEQRLNALPEEEQFALEKTWILAEMAQDTHSKPDLGSLLNQLEQTIDAEYSALPTAPDRIPTPPNKRHRLGRKIGGALVSLTIGLFLVWFALPVTERAPLGEQIQITLPDGSTAELNSGSTLSYRRFLPGFKRTVSLEGEAFFDIQSKASPFLVETFNSSVQVLGTAFNVRSWSEDNNAATMVFLEHGSVHIYSKAAPGKSVILKPGQRILLEKGKTEFDGPTQADPESEMIWRHGGFSFEGDPLADILREVERRYHVTINADSFILDRELAFFLANPQGPEVVLEVMCVSLDCIVAEDEFGYTLQAAEEAL